MPVVVGPILLALTIEHDSDFGAQAAAGALAGLLSLCVFMLAYAWTATRSNWPGAILIGWLTYSAAVAGLDQLSIDPLLALPLVLVAFVATAKVMPNDDHVVAPPTWPRWDLPVRMLVTAALVLAITGLSNSLGSHLSGLLAAFPVLTSVLVTFTHAQEGPSAAAAFLRGQLLGLVSFATFTFALAETLGDMSAVAAFGIAIAAALVTQAITSQAPSGTRNARSAFAVQPPS
jgi:hypothetical protein